MADYLHLKSGVTYTILSKASKVQINDEWHDAVIYYNRQDPKLNFVRTLEEFHEKFREIKTPYTGKRGY